MGASKIWPVIFLLLLLMTSECYALSRILLADEKSSSQKKGPLTPAPNSPPVNKELDKNQLPKPGDRGPSDSSAAKGKNGATNENRSPQNENMEAGQKGSGDPLKVQPKNDDESGVQNQGKDAPKNGEKHKDEKHIENNIPPKSPDSVKKDDGPKEANTPPKREDTAKTDDKAKEGNDPQKTKKDDGVEEGNGPPKAPDNVKKDDGVEEGNGPLKAPDNVKKDDGVKEGNGPPKAPDNVKKDDKLKANGGPTKSPDNVKSPDNGKKGDGTENGNGSLKSPDKVRKDDGPKENNGKPESKGEDREGSHVDKSQLEMCDVALQKCQDGSNLVACLQQSETANSKELVVLVQNAGDENLKVTLAVPTSVRADATMLHLTKHNFQKVNISLGGTQNLKVVLNAGKGDCIIQIGMGTSGFDWMQQFPAYARQLTPMNGAYFLLCTLAIAGVIWGCCKCRNRGRRADGVPYQQLEMGAQTQSSAEIMEASTADGWEQGWDDDWDEEATMRPSSTGVNGNISSYGLTSRSSNKKNDWDIDWDD